MDYRLLGRTGVRVSPLCLGTMNFGGVTNEEDSIAYHPRGVGRRDQLCRYGERVQQRAKRDGRREGAARSARAGRAGDEGSLQGRAKGRTTRAIRGCTF